VKRAALIGLLLVAAGARAGTLTSLCYHRFGAESSDPYKISVERLNRQLDWFRQQGYASVSLTQVAAGRLPDKALLLSVDDGYKAGALGAAAFEAHGFRGVFFVNAGSLGHGSFMTWKACRDLEKRGHEVASHTLTHANLGKPEKGQTVAQYKVMVERELAESRRRLEKELGHPVTALAYPYGAYNPAVSRAAVKAGYTLHFTVSDGVNDTAALDPLRLRRILLMGHPSLPVFIRRMKAPPVAVAPLGLVDGDLLYQGGAEAVITAPGARLSVDDKPFVKLPGKLAPGFHFLGVEDGYGRSKYLFQVAPAAWKPYFNALGEP
jgi:peptidoglycan/xylan/chitin deacetylase (PgdA/CDA1 family)